jgi:hypothetical protein
MGVIDRPPAERVIRVIGTDPDVLNRPWKPSSPRRHIRSAKDRGHFR